jgi:ribosomal protein S18 acetylase RimI-like enzyme
VENVVVAGDLRGCGIGSALMGHVIDIARAAGCYKVQLLSGSQRTGAHAFYRSLGMEPVAEGFKLYLQE